MRLPVANSSQPVCSPEAKELFVSSGKFTVLAGSERRPVRGARLIHNSHPDQVIEVSLRLRSKAESKRDELKTALSKPGYKGMSRADYEASHGADPADFEKIRKFASEYGLKIHE